MNKPMTDHEWVDDETGLICLRLSVRGGHYCGYVRVPAESALHGKDYDDALFADVEVHGGLTFANEHDGREGWWLGFDCAHYGDASRDPIYAKHGLSNEGVWRDEAFIHGECASLAKQIAAILAAEPAS